MRTQIDRQMKSLLPELRGIRHWLHQHPETRYKEFQTADFIEARLREIGLEPARVGKTGLVAMIRGGKARRGAKTVGLRADIDALEIVEQTGLPYASTNGFMHACGHDGHTTILLGAAKVLQALRPQLAGNVKLIFQPAEEIGRGGKRMVEQGVLEAPKVDAAFALHSWPELDAGGIAVSAGPAMAACDTIELTVRGKGSHGAAPHQGVDPVLIAARIIEGLQSIVSRQLAPGNAVVVTIASLRAGTRSGTNIIPDEVWMGGTIRSLDLKTRQQLIDSIRRIATGTAEAHGGACKVTVSNGYPATINDEAMADLVRSVATRLLGAKNVQPQRLSMGAEDFSYYLQRVPGCYFRLGINEKSRPAAPLHNPRFDFNDKALPVGVRMMAGVAEEYLAMRRA